MAKNFHQPGKDLNFVAAAAVNSGEVVVAGDLVGVSAGKYAIGETGVFEIEGVHKLPKATGTSFTQGAKLYYDTVNKLIVTATGANIVFIGYASQASTTALIAHVLLARPGS